MRKFGVTDKAKILEKINNAMVSGAGLKAFQEAFVGEKGVNIAPEMTMLSRINGKTMYGRIDNAVLKQYKDENGKSGYEYDVIDYKTAQKNGPLSPSNIIQIASYIATARQNQSAIKEFFKEGRFGELKEKAKSALDGEGLSTIFDYFKEFASENPLFTSSNNLPSSEEELSKMSFEEFMKIDGGESLLRNFAALSAADRFGAVALKTGQGIFKGFRISQNAISDEVWEKIIDGKSLSQDEQLSLNAAATDITGEFMGNEKVMEIAKLFSDPLAFKDYLLARTKYKSNLFKYRSLQEQLDRLGVDGDTLARQSIEEQMQTLEDEMTKNVENMETLFPGLGRTEDGGQVQASFEDELANIGKDVEGSFAGSTLEKWQKMYSTKQEKMLQSQQLQGLLDSGMLSEADKAVIAQKKMRQTKKYRIMLRKCLSVILL